MSTFRDAIPRLVSALDHHFGRPRRLVENRSPIGRLIACFWEWAISAKQTAAALAAFEDSGLSDLQAIAELDLATLQDLLKQAGLSVSTKSLAPFPRLVQRLATHSDIDLDDLDATAQFLTSSLRDELVAIPGIGQATADDILLRVFKRPRYPLDRATYRILLRHGWIDSTADYEETTELVVRNFDEDPNLLADLSHWFEELGRSHCRASGPRCENCPLQPLLPEGGPLGDES